VVVARTTSKRCLIDAGADQRAGDRWRIGGQRRPASRRSLLLIPGAAFVALLAGCGSRPLAGTDLGRQPAPDFTLTDQRDQSVRLSQFRGQAVVLTFIYTHCPDVCPAIAEKLRVVDELLPEATRARVALLAVTIDPARDTTAALQAFSTQHGLGANSRWFALRGDETTLARVWRDYGIFPGAPPTPDHHAPGGSPTTGYELGHTDAIYVIDPLGRERALLHSDFDPPTLANDLTGLVG
jgi:protein SCO1